MLPELLHGSRHDDQSAVSLNKAPRISFDLVSNPKFPSRSQGQGTDHVARPRFIISVRESWTSSNRCDERSACSRS